MNTIKANDFANAVKTLQQNHDGTVYQEVGTTDNGEKLYLVFGYQAGYDKGEAYQVEENDTVYTLCAKLAFNVDSLQCDYDGDWYMPYNDNGDVYDTDSAITKDFEGLAEYYNQESENIIAMMNDGKITIE